MVPFFFDISTLGNRRSCCPIVVHGCRADGIVRDQICSLGHSPPTIQACVIGFSGIVTRAKLCVNLYILMLSAVTSQVSSVLDAAVKTFRRGREALIAGLQITFAMLHPEPYSCLV